MAALCRILFCLKAQDRRKPETAHDPERILGKFLFGISYRPYQPGSYIGNSAIWVDKTGMVII